MGDVIKEDRGPKEMAHTFGMFHLIFKGNRAPPLHGLVVAVQMMGGAVCGEALQQHHIGACVGTNTEPEQPREHQGGEAEPSNTGQQQRPALMFTPGILLHSPLLNDT